MQPSSVRSTFVKGLVQTLMGRLKQPIRSRRRRSRFYLKCLLLGGLSLWTITGLILPVHRKSVKAAEIELARVANPWSLASFPVENYQTTTSHFGYRQSPYGGQRFHYGVDLAAPLGSYVRNWWEGRVVEITDDSACGTSVVIESGEWLHVYCHMQGYVTYEDGRRVMVDPGGNIRIPEGAIIATAQAIGRVGMTGRTTGPHLHWGLKFENSWVDPDIILTEMYYDQQAIR